MEVKVPGPFDNIAIIDHARAPMKTIYFRFYEELKDFLPPEKQKEFLQDIEGRPTVKHIIKSIGVPHTEIDLILVNGVSVGAIQKSCID